MLTFSSDPQRAEHEMHAVIFYLVTFGYIDGDFDAAEKGFVREIIRKLIEHRANQAMPDAAPCVRAEVVARYTRLQGRARDRAPSLSVTRHSRVPPHSSKSTTRSSPVGTPPRKRTTFALRTVLGIGTLSVTSPVRAGRMTFARL